MKSPFAIFRKNQKILMVIVTGMAMLSFIVFDPTSMRSGTAGRTFMYVLSGLLGGGIFWLLGRDSGKASSYAAVGVLIGLVVGYLLPTSSNTDAPVRTAMGDLSREDILQRKNRRNIANNFLRAAYERVAPPPENPFMAQFWMRGLQQSQFGYSGDPDEDVILGFLLEQEAAEMGIQLSDDAVSKYILQATTINGKGLSKADFEKICSTLRVSETELYHAIREELRCRLAIILAVPREITTPELYWEEFRKLNVKQQLDVAAVPVGEFTAEVAEPSPSELENFFEQGKNTFFDDPARRGMVQAFGQPRRIRAAYLEVDYEEVEKTIAAVTDAEIEKYYNDNKETYRNHPLTNAGGGDPFLSQPGNAGEKGTGPLLPGLAPGDGSSSTGGVAPSEKPAPEKAGEKGAESKDTPPTSSEKPQPGKSSEGKSDEKSSGDSGQARSSTNLGGLLAQGPESDLLVERELLLSALDEAGDSKEVKPAPAEPQSDAKKDTAPSTDAKQDEKGNPDASQKAGENAAKPTTEGLSESGKRRPVEALRPLPEFKPLDENLRGQIRDQLLRQRTLAAQRKIIDAARDHLSSLAETYTSKSLAVDVDMPQDKRREEILRIAREMQTTFSEDLKRYADEHKLKYVETKPLSGAEFDYEAEYAISRAIEPNIDEFSPRTPMSAAQQLFNSPADQFFQPYIATDRTDKWFAYWKIDEIAAHVPKFEDEGIREQVLAVWKSNQARPKADERAKAIADLVSKSQSSMAETLSGQTITGKEGAGALVVIPTLPFSWLTVSTAPSTGLMPNNQPTLSVIPGVDQPDSRFMETVFDQMKVGDVKVVPNADSSVFYVVKVKNRIPSEPSDLEAQRQAFLREDLFGRNTLFGGGSTYDSLIGPNQRAVQVDWFRLLNDKYRVQRNTSAESSSGDSTRPLGS